MKLRSITRMLPETAVVNGRTVTYDEPTTVQVPAIPFNLDLLVRRGLFLVALLVTAGAIVWGTVAIGSMLSTLAPAWAAYLVAGVFDLTWAGCLAAEWLARYDEERAKMPRKAGMVALAISMAAIILHGEHTGALTVGIVGALVSFAAKGLWAVALMTVRVKLDKKHQAYLRDMQQETGTALALALGERDRAMVEDRAAALRLALEADRMGANTVTVERENTAEPVREQAEPVLANTALTSANVVPEQPSIAERARELLANGSDNKQAADAILAAVPTANAASVGATIRRERKKLDGPYL